MRVGIYGGTFDPVHNGHVSLALDAIEKFGLGKVFFLLERQPRNKPGATHYRRRLAMLKLALCDYPNLDTLDFPDSNISIKNTLPRLQAEFPDDQLTFIIGSDVALTLDDWPDLNKLLPAADFIIGLRAGATEGDIRPELAKLGAEARFIKAKNYHVSSGQIRRNKAGDLINPRVLEYIKTNNLYS
jgi:nicotinate-nucleotide adenylyltransferase